MVTGGPGASRRELLVYGAGAVGLLAGCSSGSSRPKVHTIPSRAKQSDIELLNRALDIEHMAIAAYTAGIPLLDRHAASDAQRFLNQELDHAGELAGLIKQAGGKGNKPAPSYDFGRPRTDRDVKQLLRRIELLQISSYLQMLPSLSPGSVRAAVSTVLSNDAQHLAVLGSSLGLDAAEAFVTGTR